MNALYHLPVLDAHGQETTLAQYAGKQLLIVNVASRCGFTKQYAALESLYQTYKDKGLIVLGFPCNQFLHQEPGTDEEIQSFAQSCFRVTFPIFGKINVKGKQAAPLYRYLYAHLQRRPIIFVPWNFTKILVDTQGHVIKQYAPWCSFKTIERDLNL